MSNPVLPASASVVRALHASPITLQVQVGQRSSKPEPDLWRQGLPEPVQGALGRTASTLRSKGSRCCQTRIALSGSPCYCPTLTPRTGAAAAQAVAEAHHQFTFNRPSSATWAVGASTQRERSLTHRFRSPSKERRDTGLPSQLGSDEDTAWPQCEIKRRLGDVVSQSRSGAGHAVRTCVVAKLPNVKECAIIASHPRLYRGVPEG